MVYTVNIMRTTKEVIIKKQQNNARPSAYLRRILTEAERDLAEGTTVGPFHSIDELIKNLES